MKTIATRSTVSWEQKIMSRGLLTSVLAWAKQRDPLEVYL